MTPERCLRQVRMKTFAFPAAMQFLSGLAAVLLFATAPIARAQTALRIESPSFAGVIHDNESNRHRQGSGFSPLVLRGISDHNLFRDDAVGLNFEHIFNGAKEQHSISMFTPRQDPCELTRVDHRKYKLHWPSEGSQWGLQAEMIYDLTQPNQIDLHFSCTPRRDLYPQGYVAMMWASYIDRALDRRIHFWGTEGDRTGWVEFGETVGHTLELGTVSCAGIDPLPFEQGAQALNVNENPQKKFIAPFYYGVIDADRSSETDQDRLLYLMLFDQTDSIRFAMWNFFRNQQEEPDTHSPAWDWQYVIRDPIIGQRYGYRARLVVKPFSDREQVLKEYQRWAMDLGQDLPEVKRD